MEKYIIPTLDVVFRQISTFLEEFFGHCLWAWEPLMKYSIYYNLLIKGP